MAVVTLTLNVDAKGVVQLDDAARKLLGLEQAAKITSGSLGSLASVGAAMGAGFGGALGAIQAVGSALQGVASSVAEAIGAFLQVTGKLSDLSAQTGIGTTALQELGYAGSLVGVGLESITAGVDKMERGLATAPEKFAALGLSAEKLIAMDPGKAFEEVATAIGKIESPAERARVTMELFGRGGMQLMPLLRSSMSETADEAHRLGAVLGEDVVGAGDRLGDEVTKLGAAWDGLKLQLVSVLAQNPAVIQSLVNLVETVGSVATAIQENREGLSAFLGWMTDVVVRATPALAALKSMATILNDMRPDHLPTPQTGTGFAMDPEQIQFAGMMAAGLKVANEQLKIEEKAHAAAQAAAKKHADEMARLTATFTGAGLQQHVAELSSIWAAHSEEINATAHGYTSFAQEVLKAEAAGAQLTPELKEVAAAFHATQGEMGPENIMLLTAGTERFTDLIEGRTLTAVRSAQEQFDEVTHYTTDWTQALIDLGHVLDSVFGTNANVDAIVGGLAEGQQFAAGLAEATEDGFLSLNEMIAGVGALVDGFKRATDSASAMSRALGGAAFGAKAGGAIGALFGPIGAAVGMVAGAIIGGIAGIFHKPSWAKVGEEAGKILGFNISKDLAKQIEATTKSLHVTVEVATLLNLNDAMAESGAAASTFAPQIVALIDGLAAGTIPAREGIDALGEAFTSVRDEAMKAGAAGNAALSQILNAARDAGQLTEEMTSHLAEQADKIAGGLNDVIAGLSVGGNLGAAEGEQFATAFNAAIASKGMAGAVDALKDSFDKLTSAGVAVPPEIAALFTLMGSSDGLFRGAAQAASGLKAEVEGLGASGMLTASAFASMGQSAQSAFNQAVAGGASQTQALQAVMPYLQAAAQASAAQGVAVDGVTASLIQQAQAAGFSFPVDPILQVVDLLKVVVQQLGGEIPASAQAAGSSFSAISSGAESATSTATGALATLGPAATTAAGDVSTAVLAGFASMAGTVESALDATTASAIGMVGNIQGAISGLGAGVTVPVHFAVDSINMPGGEGGMADIKHAAYGAIVPATSGGVPYIVGEGGSAEVIAPVSAFISGLRGSIARDTHAMLNAQASALAGFRGHPASSSRTPLGGDVTPIGMGTLVLKGGDTGPRPGPSAMEIGRAVAAAMAEHPAVAVIEGDSLYRATKAGRARVHRSGVR